MNHLPDAKNLKTPVPVETVAQALCTHAIATDLAWWLAQLDRRVWEIEQRVTALERSDVTG